MKIWLCRFNRSEASACVMVEGCWSKDKNEWQCLSSAKLKASFLIPMGWEGRGEDAKATSDFQCIQAAYLRAGNDLGIFRSVLQ